MFIVTLIYHFFIGADRGILKRISFQKTDQKYVKEARWQQGGYDGLTQLREPYEINIELFGNSRLFPGQMIYVNPAGLGSTVGSPADNGSMASGTEDSEYVACPELTAITADGGTQAPTND